MSAAQFLEALFGKLPEFFKDEDELRRNLERPDTRRKLLEGLAEKGFGKRAAGRDAEDHRGRKQRPVRRAGAASSRRPAEFTDKQQAFIDFVLAQYVSAGRGRAGRRPSSGRCSSSGTTTRCRCVCGSGRAGGRCGKPLWAFSAI
jgi:hypothetical protein